MIRTIILLCFSTICSTVFADGPGFFVLKGEKLEDILPVAKIKYEERLSGPGWEERGPEFIPWLAPSVRINGGSGTMCFYDPQDNWMYVISCGHLFKDGYYSREYYKKNPKSITVEVFYHNDKKLSQWKGYKAEIVCHVCEVWGSNGIWDVSLMRFHPDWENPVFAPIAPEDYKMESGKMYHSLGCDGRSEVAHYLVEFVNERQRGAVTEYVTVKNAPRGGRSGGGVMTDDVQLVAICSRGGGDYGYWSSLNQIYKLLRREKLDFILETPARKIPIKDMNNPQEEYPKDYIPLPGRRAA
jgi:hypothetical protein